MKEKIREITRVEKKKKILKSERQRPMKRNKMKLRKSKLSNKKLKRERKKIENNSEEKIKK